VHELAYLKFLDAGAINAGRELTQRALAEQHIVEALRILVVQYVLQALGKLEPRRAGGGMFVVKLLFQQICKGLAW
jgi:hypothetical protein